MAIFYWPIQVYYEDTDAGGVVYHSNYLKFFERARTEMLRDWGYQQDALMTEQGIVFAVRSMSIDFLKPARFNDSLTASAEIIQIKKVSLDFSQQLRKNDEVLCQAQVKIVCLDAQKFKPKPIPAFLAFN